MQRVDQALATERLLAGADLVEQGAEGEDVDAMVHLDPLDLLGAPCSRPFPSSGPRRCPERSVTCWRCHRSCGTTISVSLARPKSRILA